MSHFVTGVSDDIVDECRLEILHDNIYISRLMVHFHQVNETRLKRKNREFKRDKSYEGGTFKGRLDIQDKPRFKKRVCKKVPSNFPNSNKDRVYNLIPKRQEVEFNQVTNLLVLSMLRSIGVNGWWEWEISLVVEKRAITLGIAII